MRRDIQLEIRSAEAKGERRATIAFALSYRGRDPQTVALVTNTIASFYIEENLKARERQASGTTEFLKAQINQTKKRLDEQEQRVGDFKRRYLGELPQQMQGNLANLEALNTQLRLNSDNQVRTAERREALIAQLADAESFGQQALGVPGAPAGPEPPALHLARLKQDLTAARTRYTDSHPTVIRLKEEIAAVEREARQRQARAQAGRQARGGARSGDSCQSVCAPASGGSPCCRSRAHDPQNRGQASAGRHRRLPGPGGEHAKEGAGVPGYLAGLRIDQGGASVARQALRGSSGLGKHGAASEGGAVPIWTPPCSMVTTAPNRLRCHDGLRFRPPCRGAAMLAEIDTSFHSAAESACLHPGAVLLSICASPRRPTGGGGDCASAWPRAARCSALPWLPGPPSSSPAATSK